MLRENIKEIPVINIQMIIVTENKNKKENEIEDAARDPKQ